MDKRQAKGVGDPEKGKYSLIRNVEDYQAGIYDKPLPCFGCGIGWFSQVFSVCKCIHFLPSSPTFCPSAHKHCWFSFLLGFVFPLMWYCATILYFESYYCKDPRERAGLAASAIAAMACSVVLLIIVLITLL